MSETTKINRLADILAEMADHQKVAIIMLKNGERHHLKVLTVRGMVMTGEARCLYHNYDIGRKIHQHAIEEEKKNSLSTVSNNNPASGLTMADAIDRFGTEAHRFRFHIDIHEIHSVAEDLDDVFDETPYFPGLL